MMDKVKITYAPNTNNGHSKAYLPFKLDKEGALGAVCKYTSGLFTRPFFFTTGASVGQYFVPFRLFSGKLEGKVNSRISIDGYNFENNFRLYNKVFVDGRVGLADIPVDASNAMDDSLMDELAPFDMTELTEIKPQDVPEIAADTDNDICVERFKMLAMKAASKAFLRKNYAQYKRELADDPGCADIIDVSSRLVYLPVYYITCTAEGRRYVYAVNGQTGEVTGPKPVSVAKKRVFFFLCWALLTCLMLACVNVSGRYFLKELLPIYLILCAAAGLISLFLKALIFRSAKTRLLQREDSAAPDHVAENSLEITDSRMVTDKVESLKWFDDPRPGRTLWKITGRVLLIALRIIFTSLLEGDFSNSGSSSDSSRSSRSGGSSHSSGGSSRSGGGSSRGGGGGRSR